MAFVSLNECPIWKIPISEVPHQSPHDILFDSPRAGGKFRYFIDLQSYQFPEDQAALISTWIIDQHLSGIDQPILQSSMIGDVLRRPRLKFSEKTRRFFQYLSTISFKPGDELPQNVSTYARQVNTTMAWIEAANTAEFDAFIELLAEEGLLKHATYLEHVTLTAKGFARLEEIETKAVASKQGFVAMWFDKSLDAAYKEGIAPAIRDAGYDARRIDEKDHVNDITDEILMEIRRSRFVVADFTSGFITLEDIETPKLMPCAGAYFEAGYALGQGIPVIWTARRDCLNAGLHFDTNHHAHVVWDTPEDLRVSLRNRIGAVIGSPVIRA
jgi:nucleoside 2-deoxyribosyltransferase